MRFIDIAFKDISQILRDRRSLIFLIAMPAVFTVLLGLVFKDSAAEPDPRLALGWVNHDPGELLSEQLHQMLSSTEGLRLEEVDPAQVDEAVRSGKLAGALVVPQNFSAQALAGKPVQLSLVGDELSATGQSLFQLARAPVTRLMSSLEIARLASAAVQAGTPAADEVQRQAEIAAAFNQAALAWQESAAGSGLLVEKAQGQAAPSRSLGGNPYNQTSPGILVQFAIFSLVTSATLVVQERKTRTMQRMLTTSMRPSEIIAGHLLAMAAVVLLQELLLCAFGQLVLGVNYMRQPLGSLLVMAGLALWVASMGLLIGAISKDEEQVGLLALVASFFFTALGGAWFPLEGTGRLFFTIGNLTPAAWAMTGFQNILIRGLGTASLLLPAAILLAYTLAFFAAAVWRFRYE